MRKILSANIKTIDEKNHVKIWTLDSIEKIIFKGENEPKPTPKKEENKEPKKDSKKKKPDKK